MGTSVSPWPEDIVSADWCTLAFSPASYVALDHAAKTVVVAIRGTVSGGRGLHSSTSQLNLSRFGHTSRVPLSNRLGESHAANVCTKITKMLTLSRRVDECKPLSGGDLLTDACSTSVPFLGGWAHAGRD